MKNTYIITGVIALVFSGAFWLIAPGKVAQTVQQFGSLAGPDIPSPYLKWGGGIGLVVRPTGVALTTATTTPCAIQSPAATSTLEVAGIRLDVSSSTATTWTIARATTAFATTTQIGTNYTVAANTQAFINASTSPAAGAPEVFPPNNWLVFSETGGITSGDSGTGFVPSGECSAQWVN